MATQAKSNETPAPSGDRPTTLSVEELTDKPNATAADLQFPSLAGKPKVEVASRAADVDKLSSAAFEKVFVLLKRDWAIVDRDETHAANKRAVREYLIHQGLRSGTVDVTFMGEEEVPQVPGRPGYDDSVGLRYRVEATPAVVAPDSLSEADVDGNPARVELPE